MTRCLKSLTSFLGYGSSNEAAKVDPDKIGSGPVGWEELVRPHDAGL